MSDPNQRVRLKAHRISPLPAAAISLLVTGAAHASIVANNDIFHAVVTKGTQVIGNVLANDTGNPPFAITHNTNPAQGYVLIDAAGNLAYTANACLAVGMTESLSYSVQDSDPSFSQAMVTINIVSGSTDDSYTTTANHAVSGDVRSNDLPAGSPFSVTSSTTASNGNAVVDTSNSSSNGQFTYTPVANFSGYDQFGYSTASGCNTIAQVDITVLPLAVSDTYVDPTSGPVSGNVLTNDAGSGLHLTTSTSPAHGTANVAADGSFTYVPTAGFTGTDSFTYTVQDSSAQAASATVRITVGAVPSLPATTPAALGLLATFMVWLGLRRRRRET